MEKNPELFRVTDSWVESSEYPMREEIENYYSISVREKGVSFIKKYNVLYSEGPNIEDYYFTAGDGVLGFPLILHHNLTKEDYDAVKSFLNRTKDASLTELLSNKKELLEEAFKTRLSPSIIAAQEVILALASADYFLKSDPESETEIVQNIIADATDRIKNNSNFITFLKFCEKNQFLSVTSYIEYLSSTFKDIQAVIDFQKLKQKKRKL